jgi:hypothetical protein
MGDGRFQDYGLQLYWTEKGPSGKKGDPMGGSMEKYPNPMEGAIGHPMMDYHHDYN